VTVRFQRFGRGADLVLLHGWGLNAGVWSDIIPALAKRFRVYAVDLPGYGRSRAVSTGINAAADAIAAAIPTGSIVCGWSMGGLVAQRLVLRHPRKVAALALAGSSPCFVERDDWPHAMKAQTIDAFAATLRDGGASALADFVRLSALNGARPRAAIRTLSQRIGEGAAPPSATLEEGLEWLRSTDARAQTRSLRLPVLVIHGQRDMVAPIGAGRWLAEAIPSARLIELGDAAHAPFITHRDEFVHALESIVA